MIMKRHYLDKVRDGYHKGWLKVKLSNSNEVALPYGLLVEKVDSSSQGETIKILEGVYEGITATAPFLKDNESYFSMYTKFKTGPVVLKMRNKQLQLNEKLFPVVFDDSIKVGNYFLFLPDYPHRHIAIGKYQREAEGGSRFASTWFKFVKDGDSLFQSSSYLHFGTYSEGCITFPFFKMSGASSWNELVLALSLLRLRGGVCSQLQIIK